MYSIHPSTGRYDENYFWARAAEVHLNFRARSTFPVLVCTVPPGRGQQRLSSSVYRTSWGNEVDAVRLYSSISWIYFYYSQCFGSGSVSGNHWYGSETLITATDLRLGLTTKVAFLSIIFIYLFVDLSFHLSILLSIFLSINLSFNYIST